MNTCPCFPRRVVVCILAFFGVLTIFILRTNLSIAIVSMTIKKDVFSKNGTVIQRAAEFNWDSKQRGYVLSAFFYGYAPVQLFGGWMGTRYGGATMLGIGVALTSIVTIGLPLAAYCNFYAIILFRILAGVFEGISYPCIHSLMSKWAPRQETTTMISFVYTGASVGVVLSTPIYGLIAQYFSWTWLFYISGIIALVWCFFWFNIVKDDPKNDPWITEKELKYIQTSTGHNGSVKSVSYPWIQMITSKHVWAIVSSHFADGWGMFTLVTLLPTILSDIWKFEVREAGYLSAIPFTATIILHLVCGLISDYLRKRLPTITIRKVMNSAGTFIPGTVFLILTYISSPYLAVALLSIGSGFCTFSTVTVFANYLDIAPRYSGILFGISSTIACTSGILTPIIAGHIVTHRSVLEWRIMFFLTAGIYYTAGIIYLLFASCMIQKWARSTSDDGKGNKHALNHIECG